MIIALILMIILFLFIFIGIPVSFAMGVTALVGILLIGGNLMQIIPQSIFAGMSSFPLIAIPLFILAGELMNASGITQRLVRFANLFVGRLPAGLAHTTIVSSMLFSGISGAAAADTSAIGGVLIPAMEQEGYPKDFAAAMTAAATVNGPIIPPSIMMVMYGATIGVSIGALFAGGFIPGAILGLVLMATVLILDHRIKLPRRKEKISFAAALKIIKDAIIPLLMPVIILGGILGGIFTPTEASAVAVLYALIVGFFILKTLKISDLLPMLKTTAISTATILFILGAAGILNWVFTVLRVQITLGELFKNFSGSPIIFLFLINIILLILGTFIDSGAGIILFAPILAPIAEKLGINPILFGVIMIINLSIGHITPPLGNCIFIASSIAKIPLEKMSIAIIPFLIAEIVALFIITYIPQTVLWLPKLFGYM